MFTKETHILVVDDSLNIRKVVVDGLGRLGFKKVVTAAEANEGFSKLTFFADTPNPIGLVLSDLNMPGMNGIEFLRKVRADERFKDLPFILVTTEGEKGYVIEAAVSGVSAYVIKPFNLETLTKRLNDAWQKHTDKE